MGPTETRLRTVARALSWRAIAVTVAVLLGWFLTGDLGKSLGFGLAYNAIQLITQYVHDRWWARVEWGQLGREGGDAPAKARPLSVVAWAQAPEDALPERQANPAAPSPAWAAPPTPWTAGAQWAGTESLPDHGAPELPHDQVADAAAADAHRRPYRSAS